MARILIVEDETVLATAMADTLTAVRHTVSVVHAGERVQASAREFRPDLILLDIRLGAVNGLDLLPDLKAEWPDLDAIVLTAYGSVETAVEAMKRGASDFLTKPIDLDVLTLSIDKVLAASRARKRLGQFEAAQEERLKQVDLIGQCPAIQEIRNLVSRIAERSGASGHPPASILLTGETGTGKDLLATLLHSRLPHRNGPFVSVNCAAIPSELFESELFGHKRGSFSGATADKAGLFETADEGSLLLDEIAELPLPLQSKLLRAIETQTIRRVGETTDRPVSLCLIAATNRNLEQCVSDGRFRGDLYYRLKLATFELPPLRNRGGDIDLLADSFCEKLAVKYAQPRFTLSAEARTALHSYSWPGNVRELLYTLERAVLTTSGPLIQSLDLVRKLGSVSATSSHPLTNLLAPLIAGQPISLDEVEKVLLEQALSLTGCNVSASARLLSITREAMRYRMGKFNLSE